MDSPQPTTPGSTFRSAVESERPLQVAGTINAYCAMLAEQAGFKAVYVSGAGVANARSSGPGHDDAR
jgi:methylisocitrate lyase